MGHRARLPSHGAERYERARRVAAIVGGREVSILDAT